MRNFFRILLLGISIGGVIGYWVAEEKQRRVRLTAKQAFENDPEIIAHRRQRATMYSIDDYMDRLEDGYEE